MSHFSVIVFVPKDTTPAQLQHEVAKRLAAYDETIEVESYQTPCFCVGRKAKDDADAHANRVHGDHNARRQKVKQQMETQTDVSWPEPRGADTERSEAENDAFFAQVQAYSDRSDEFWQQSLGPWKATAEAFLATHPDRARPNAACDECSGTGIVTTTYNPRSKWDWWTIGGRWNGTLAPVDQRGNGHKQNVARAVDLPEDWIPYAIVTADGEWHQRGEMGWWGMASNEKDEQTWKAEASEIASGHANHIAVLVDAHI